jgi:myosin-1
MKARPSYIRTIKPNQNRSPSEYDVKAVLHQIKYLGLQENIRVRRAGFAYRNTFEKMVERFYLLSPKTSYAGEYIWDGDARSGCQQILKDTGIAKDEWQMGVTKAFIKNPETVCFLSRCRLQCIISLYSSSHWKQCAIDTGTIWQGESSVLGGTTCDISTSVLGVYNDSGKTIKKDLRMPKSATTVIRFSLAGKRGGDSACSVTVVSWVIISMSTEKVPLEKSWHLFAALEVGVFNSLSLSHTDPLKAEPVTFSGRIQLLVSKLGRSSKPSPRFIIVVSFLLPATPSFTYRCLADQ